MSIQELTNKQSIQLSFQLPPAVTTNRLLPELPNDKSLGGLASSDSLTKSNGPGMFHNTPTFGSSFGKAILPLRNQSRRYKCKLLYSPGLALFSR